MRSRILSTLLLWAIVGFSLLYFGVHAAVALITLLEVVLGPLWVWLARSERPSASTLAGGAVVVAAVLVQAFGDRGEAPG